MTEIGNAEEQGLIYQLLYEISAEFIDLSGNQFNETVTRSLHRIMSFLGVDRMTLVLYEPD